MEKCFLVAMRSHHPHCLAHSSLQVNSYFTPTNQKQERKFPSQEISFSLALSIFS